MLKSLRYSIYKKQVAAEAGRDQESSLSNLKHLTKFISNEKIYVTEKQKAMNNLAIQNAGHNNYKSIGMQAFGDQNQENRSQSTENE